MKKLLPRPKLSYANVIATVALFLALTGGAYAANVLPRSSVGTSQIKDSCGDWRQDQAWDSACQQLRSPERFLQGQQGVPGISGQPGDDRFPRSARRPR